MGKERSEDDRKQNKGRDEGMNIGIRESFTPHAFHPRNLTPLLNLSLTPRVSHEESSSQAFQRQNHRLVIS